MQTQVETECGPIEKSNIRVRWRQAGWSLSASLFFHLPINGARSFLRAFLFVLLENTLSANPATLEMVGNGRGRRPDPPLFLPPPKPEMMPRLLHRQCAESAQSPTPKGPCTVGHWHWCGGPEQKVTERREMGFSRREPSPAAQTDTLLWAYRPHSRVMASTRCLRHTCS